MFPARSPTTCSAGIPSGKEYKTWMGNNGFGPLPADDVIDFGSVGYLDGDSPETGGTFEYIVGGYYQDNEMYVDGLSQFNLVGIGGLLGANCAAGGGTCYWVISIIALWVAGGISGRRFYGS